MLCYLGWLTVLDWLTLLRLADFGLLAGCALLWCRGLECALQSAVRSPERGALSRARCALQSAVRSPERGALSRAHALFNANLSSTSCLANDPS
jgi:hypothetical protein